MEEYTYTKQETNMIDTQIMMFISGIREKVERRQKVSNGGENNKNSQEVLSTQYTIDHVEVSDKKFYVCIILMLIYNFLI